ncbi:hypothetical protein HYU06_01555 [Candidatus Woesearchaeota archaeon]|nr:hypothetical protein [Candidatus Woesearchaeota archaeon]
MNSKKFKTTDEELTYYFKEIANAMYSRIIEEKTRAGIYHYRYTELWDLLKKMKLRDKVIKEFMKEVKRK